MENLQLEIENETPAISEKLQKLYNEIKCKNLIYQSFEVFSDQFGMIPMDNYKHATFTLMRKVAKMKESQLYDKSFIVDMLHSLFLFFDTLSDSDYDKIMDINRFLHTHYKKESDKIEAADLLLLEYGID